MNETAFPFGQMSPVVSPRGMDAEERANKVLLQLVRLAHAMSERERELALVLLQSITAWGGLQETA